MNLHPVPLSCNTNTLFLFLNVQPTVSVLSLTIRHKYNDPDCALVYGVCMHVHDHTLSAETSGHVICNSFSWSMFSAACLIVRTGVMPQLVSCYLEHADLLLPHVPLIWSCHVLSISAYEWVRCHTWEAKCISSFAFSYISTWCMGWRFYVCFCAFLDCVTWAIHTAALPCQQDKTAVVKQSKQSPLTAAMSLWCDLQTGFLPCSLAILWQAQETHSAGPDKKLDQKGKRKSI